MEQENMTEQMMAQRYKLLCSQLKFSEATAHLAFDLGNEELAEISGLEESKSGIRATLFLQFVEDRPHIGIRLQFTREMNENFKKTASTLFGAQYQFMCVRLFNEAIYWDDVSQVERVRKLEGLPPHLSRKLFVKKSVSKGHLFRVSLTWNSAEAREAGVYSIRHFSGDYNKKAADAFASLKYAGSVQCFLGVDNPDFGRDLECMKFGLRLNAGHASAEGPIFAYAICSFCHQSGHSWSKCKRVPTCLKCHEKGHHISRCTGPERRDGFHPGPSRQLTGPALRRRRRQ